MTASALDPELKHLNLRDHLFNGVEQGRVEDILVVLKLMKRATIFVSAEKQPTSRVLPTLAKLRMEMTVSETDSALAKQMKQNILDNLNKRYSDQSVRCFYSRQVSLTQDTKVLMI